MYKKTFLPLLVALTLTACQQPSIAPEQIQPEEEGPPLLTATVPGVIPPELLDLAPGKDAEALIIGNLPDSLVQSVTDENIKAQLQKLKGGVLVTKKDPLKPGLPYVWLGIVFRDEAAAQEALDFYQKSSFISSTTKEQLALERQQNLLVSKKENSARFLGKLSEHSELSKITGLTPQPIFFAYQNSTRIPELNLTLKSQSPILIDPLNNPDLSAVFNAATFSAKELTTLGEWQDNQLKLTVKDVLISDQKILGNLMLSTLFPANNTQPVTEEQKTFVSSTVQSTLDEYKEVYTNKLSAVKTFIEQKNSEYPELISLLDLKPAQLDLTLLVKPPALENFYGQMVAGWNYNENKAKNYNKQTILSDIMTALDQYRIQNNRYPENDGCLENVLEIKTFVKNNVIPKDPQGPQKFGDTLCKSGFLLQKINDDNYILWAKTEGEKQGNTEWPETDTSAGKGNFYIIKLEYLPALEQPLLEEPPLEEEVIPNKPKVKRPL